MPPGDLYICSTSIAFDTKTHLQINRPKKSAYEIGLTDLGGTQRLEAIHLFFKRTS